MKIVGLAVSAKRSVLPAFLVLTGIPIVARGVYTALFRRQKLESSDFLAVPLLGIGVAAVHLLGQLVHQAGHAAAARASGHPMTGIRFEYGFTYSEYPANEPALPDRVHLQRSFGGVAGATLFLIVTVLLWLRRGAATHWFARWFLGFALLDALILFFASAVLSDGVLFIREEGWKTDPADSTVRQ